MTTRILTKCMRLCFVNNQLTYSLPTKINAPVLANDLPSKFSFIRNYAKNKDRGKDNKKKPAKIEINLRQMSEVIPVDKLKNQCEKCIEKLKEDFVKHLSLRSTTGSIESLSIHLANEDYELQELAQIVRKNPKTIVLNLSSFPQAIPSVLKAIQSSGLNLNPQQDGTTLYVPVPKVTKEHREMLAKNSKMLYIKCRDALKEVQNDYIRKVKKSEISEDEAFSLHNQIIAFCEVYQKQALDLHTAKTEELIGKE